MGHPGTPPDRSAPEAPLPHPSLPPRTWIWPGVVALALIMGIVVFDAATSPDVSAADDKCHSAEQTAAGGVTECIAAFFTKAVFIGVNGFAVAALGTTLYMAVRRRRRFRPCPRCDRPMPAENQTCRRCGETSAGW